MELSQSMISENEVPSGDQLQHLLNNYITYGPAQDKLARPLYLLLFSEGCETIAIGLLLPILQKEWGLSAFQQSLLIMMIYFGVAIGSYLEVYSDRLGRHKFIIYNSVIQTVFGLLSCICWNYTSFLVTRFFFGIGIGICLPLSASYITQISPSNMRATLLSRSRVYWSMGAFFACVLGWVFLRNDSWRVLLLALCLPGIYALYSSWREGKESLRYLWSGNQRQETYELANYMAKLNGQLPISRSYLYGLMEAHERQRDNEVSKDIPIGQMFNKKYKESTIRLIICWATVCFIYYGIMILLPTILAKIYSSEDVNKKYVFLMVVALFQVAGFFLARIVIDNPRVSRKRGVYWGLFFISLSSFLAIFTRESILGLFLLMAFIKLVISATFMILYPYTAQIYETMIRGKALGLFSACGRVSIMLMGFVGIKSIGWLDGSGLYLIFMFISGIASYAGFTMPYCTGNRPIQ